MTGNHRLPAQRFECEPQDENHLVSMVQAELRRVGQSLQSQVPEAQDRKRSLDGTLSFQYIWEAKTKTTHHASLCPTQNNSTELLKASLEFICKRVSLNELREIVRESESCSSGKETCLPHTPTPHLSVPTPSCDKFLCADNTGSNGCTFEPKIILKLQEVYRSRPT